jgi:ubiquinone/menaquinone biosynthesis C-methylase UbiE
MSFEQESYKKHNEHYAEQDPELVETWLQDDTVDAWRHFRMYAMADPLLENYKNNHWLTLGDGRYGTDAHYIMSKGCQAHASDISDYCLKEAAKIGFIKEYSVQNAEQLTFEDNSFDFVMCKESSHHFPRPAKAL